MPDSLIFNEEDFLKEFLNFASIKGNNEIIRARFLQNYIFSNGVKDVIIDPMGNLLAKKESKNGKYIVIHSNLDNIEVNSVKLNLKAIIGRGIAENLIGLYTLAYFSKLILKEEFKYGIYFLASSNSKNNMKGLKYFFENHNGIEYFINLKGNSLGKIGFDTFDYLKLNILIESSNKNNWGNLFEKSGINFVINFFSKLLQENFATEIKLKDLNYGINNIKLVLELRDKNMIELEKCFEIIDSILKTFHNETGITYSIYKEIKREKKKNNFNDDFLKIMEQINKKLEIKTIVEEVNNEIYESLSRNIKSISIGMVECGKIYEADEFVEIQSIYRGIEQLYFFLKELDEL